MKKFQTTYLRILAIAPSSRGFGFALFEGQGTLVDWGVKSVQGDKNAQCLAKVKDMIAHYQPGVVVLENTSVKNSRRSPRIRNLTRRIIALAASCNVGVRVFSRKQVRKDFFADGGEGTKYALAEKIAKRFPEELGFRLPPKRRAWESEDSRMDIFDAVAIALAFNAQRKQFVEV